MKTKVRDRETGLTAATMSFKVMITYGQFAWYEPLRMTVMKMMKLLLKWRLLVGGGGDGDSGWL